MEQRDEKLPAAELPARGGVIGWLDNFWYHYKWYVIIIAFFLIVGIVCFSQCTKNENAALNLTSAAGVALNQTESAGVQAVFDAIAPHGEGGERVSSRLLTYSVYTDEELRVLFTDEDGNFSALGYQSARQQSLDQFSAVQTYMQTGDCSVWFLSGYVLGEIAENLLLPLSEVYGEALPPSAVSAYAVRLGDTDLYHYYDAMKVFPADTLVVMTKKFVVTSDEQYRLSTDFFRAIVDFERP